MLHLHSPARAALLLAVCAIAPALAAQDTSAPRPDHPRAEVPETRHTPAITHKPAEKPATTPDRHWIEANRTVSGYQPMMLTMPERPAPKDAPKEHGHGEKGHH